MRKELSEAANQLNNGSVQAWKAAGKKVVGYSCTYVPSEIIGAAGLLPYRLRGIEAATTDIGDSYYGPVVCSYPKCLLQLAGEGTYRFLDGAIITNGCDTMRRLEECWRKANEDIPGILPAYYHYYGTPHKVEPYSLKWFEEENRLLIESLENHFGVKITDERLREQIELYNTGRRLLQRLEKLRMRDEIVISGTDATTIILASTALPWSEYVPLLEETLGELEQAKPNGMKGKRVLLGGSVTDDTDLVRVIEEAGAVVVADTLCFGSKLFDDLVSTEGDPVKALSERYLNRSFCPRMFAYYQPRYQSLKEKALKAKVDGVILQNVRFCDMHGSENGLFERDLEAMGIPCIRIEREYGPLVEDGRVRMRVDAFLERIQ
ncbi:MAG: 2-hydroxyacyl-CoA dehydratase family protein [Syntrophaceae bacterium]